MFKNKANFLISLKYIIVSGASKGFNYILLFYFAIGVYSEQYITILLLLSLEQILSLLLPLNHSSLIYSKSITNYKLITNKMTTNSIVMVLLFVFSYIIFNNQVSDYYEVDNITVFISIFVSMLINSYLVHLTNYYKIIEEHRKALVVQALFLISFLCIILLTLVLQNVIVAFFLGKALGLLIVLIILKSSNLLGFDFKISFLSIDELKKVLNLFSVSALGWASQLGFLNFAKLYSTSEELIKMGYILNVYGVFLLLSIGVNSIYAPLVKKHLLKDHVNMAIKIKSKTLMIYLLIAFIAYILYIILSNMDFSFSDKVKDIISIIPYSILVLVFNSFNWVVQPFYLINDKFKNYNLINIISYILWGLFVIVSLFLEYKNFVVFLLSIHFIKSAFAFYYAKRTFISRGKIY
jgi:hypothetical protein